MDLVILEAMTGLTTVAMMVIALFAMILKGVSVRRSHQRYVATSITVICCALSSMGLLAVAIINCLQGDIGSGAYNLFLSLVWALYAVIHWDDDNWFKQQFRRLKKGLKKLRSVRIRVHVPRLVPMNPMPTPALAPVRVK